jgi:hypothetical protein
MHLYSGFSAVAALTPRAPACGLPAGEQADEPDDRGNAGQRNEIVGDLLVDDGPRKLVAR